MTGQTLTIANVSAETASASQSGVSFREAYREALLVLNVADPSTVVGDTLDVYVDTSPDGGTTWVNVGHFTQILGNGGAKVYFMPLGPSNIGGSTQVFTPAGTSDLSASATRPIGICDRLRTRSVIAGSTPSFTYTVKAYLK